VDVFDNWDLQNVEFVVSWKVVVRRKLGIVSTLLVLSNYLEFKTTGTVYKLRKTPSVIVRYRNLLDLIFIPFSA